MILVRSRQGVVAFPSHPADAASASSSRRICGWERESTGKAMVMATKAQHAVFSAGTGTGPENLSFKLSADQTKRVAQVLKSTKADASKQGGRARPKGEKPQGTS